MAGHGKGDKEQGEILGRIMPFAGSVFEGQIILAEGKSIEYYFIYISSPFDINNGVLYCLANAWRMMSSNFFTEVAVLWNLFRKD